MYITRSKTNPQLVTTIFTQDGPLLNFYLEKTMNVYYRKLRKSSFCNHHFQLGWSPAMHLRFTKRKFGWYRTTFSSLRVRLVRYFMSLKAHFQNSKFCFTIAILYIYIFLQILILNLKYHFVIAYPNAPLSSLQVKYYYLPKVK